MKTLENSRRRFTKDQYLSELLIGNTRLDIPGIWGITSGALQKKLAKWEMTTLLEEEKELMNYSNRFSDAVATNPVPSIIPVEDPVNLPQDTLPPETPGQKELNIWLKLPVVHQPISHSAQLEEFKKAIHELDLEANQFHGRGQLVFKALEVMFALNSLLYLDAYELSHSEYFSKQQLRRLTFAANKQYVFDINKRVEENDWKVIFQ